MLPQPSNEFSDHIIFNYGCIIPETQKKNCLNIPTFKSIKKKQKMITVTVFFLCHFFPFSPVILFFVIHMCQARIKWLSFPFADSLLSHCFICKYLVKLSARKVVIRETGRKSRFISKATKGKFSITSDFKKTVPIKVIQFRIKYM